MTLVIKSWPILVLSFISLHCQAELCRTNLGEIAEGYPAPVFLTCDERTGWVRATVVPVRIYFDVQLSSERRSIHSTNPYSILEFVLGKSWPTPVPYVWRTLNEEVLSNLPTCLQSSVRWRVAKFEIDDCTPLYENAEMDFDLGPKVYADYRSNQYD